MSDITKTTLAAHLSYVQKQEKDLLPDGAILQKLFPFKEAEKVGRKLLIPVDFSFDQGVSYGDATAFALNDSVAADSDEIEVESFPVVLKSTISGSAVNALEANKDAKKRQWAVNRVTKMIRSLSRRFEIAGLYGGSGIGTVESCTVGSPTTTGYIVLTAASWASGIWAGMKNAKIDIYNGASKITATTPLTITAIDSDNRKITFSGTAADIGNIASTHTVYFYGAYGKEMIGLDAQITSSATRFGIDPATNELFMGNSSTAGSAKLTMAKVLTAVAKGVDKGGLQGKVVVLCNPTAWENLNSDLSALRSMDSSYSKSKGENGVEAIEYHSQAGLVQVVAHPCIKGGEAFVLPREDVSFYGQKDIGMVKLANGEFIKAMEGYHGFELRAEGDKCIILEAPAKACKITNIVNS